MSHEEADIQVTPELLAKYDRPGPRYTSYPTAPEFATTFTPEVYAERLKLARSRAADRPLSLYLHLPFCEHRCHFCGCHVVITSREDILAKYLEYLYREIDMVAESLGSRRNVLQLHWGGGTPTHLAPDQMRDLFEYVARRFNILPNAEVAIEVDPRVTTPGHIDTLTELGFNRISLGVQDFNDEVQEAIGRHQTVDQTTRLFEHARRNNFSGINVDLVYGLPRQDVASFERSLEQVIALGPDRLAVYSYAHVPWVKPNQRRIEVDELPDADTKFALLAAAIRSFKAAGYVQIGMDHFARPDDELALALGEGTLGRNFMGYTVKAAPDMIAFGISGIGDVAGAYAQNVKKLSDYYNLLDAGRFPVERGYILEEDDHIRRYVIHALMCNLELDFDHLRKRFGVEYEAYFGDEDRELVETIEPRFFERTPQRILVTPLGQLFVRNICMIYDRYLRNLSPDKNIFSRTV